MSRLFQPHKEILPLAQKQLWPQLSPASELGFTLYGGTAIALRLGHRPSVDFDFFNEKPLDRAILEATFPFLAHATVLQDEPNAFSVLVPSGHHPSEHVKVSFFGAISFGRVGEPDITEDGILQVASFDDLMATKVKVMLQRIEAKDYRDIAAMVQAGVNLSRGLAAAKAMYSPHFQPSECLKTMMYFEGGDLHTLSANEKDLLVRAVSAVRHLPKVEILSRQLTLSANEHPAAQVQHPRLTL